jgi:hypothetical protein
LHGFLCVHLTLHLDCRIAPGDGAVSDAGHRGKCPRRRRPTQCRKPAMAYDGWFYARG